MISTNEVTTILGIKTERLRQWVKFGYIKPTVKASGSGTNTYYSKYDLFRIGFFKKLIDVGFKRWVASKFANKFSNDDWDVVWNKYFIVSGTIDRSKNWSDTMKLSITTNPIVNCSDKEIVIVIDLWAIKKSVLDQIDKNLHLFIEKY